MNKDDYEISELPSSDEEGKPSICNICNYKKAIYSVKSEEYGEKVKIYFVCKDCLQYFNDNNENEEECEYEKNDKNGKSN
jgi:hypothetical protein